MRAFITAILLFALIISGVCINAIYVCNSCFQLYRLTEAIDVSDSNQSALSTLESHWRKHRDILSLSVSDRSINRMDELISSLRVAIEREDGNECNKFRALISSLAQDMAKYEKISFFGVF